MNKIRTIRDQQKIVYKAEPIDISQADVVWQTLHSFGISRDDVIRQKLPYEALFEIHCAVKTYIECKKELERLTRKLN